MEVENMEQEKKLKKVNSFQNGSVWLNVLEAKDGTELFTINRSYKTSDGWKSTPFFRLQAGDTESIRGVLDQYEQGGSEVKE